MARHRSATWRGKSGTNETRKGALDHPFPQFLFYATVALIPFYRWRRIPGVESIKVDWVLTGLLLLIIGLYLMLQKGPPKRLRAGFWAPFGLFLLINYIAYILSPYPDTAFSGMIMLLQGAIFIFMTQLIVSEHGFAKVLPWTIGLSMGLGSLLAVLGYFFGFESFNQGADQRALGGTSTANNLALMCVFTLPITVHWLMHGRNTLFRLLGGAISVLVFLGVIATVSRGGFLSLLTIMGLLVFQYRKRFKPRYLGLTVAIISITAIAVVAIIPEDFFIRQATLVTEGTQDKSLNRRSHYVDVAIDAFEKRPIPGWGPDTFKKVWVNSLATRMFDLEERAAHNTYLEVAVGSGIIGLILFLFILIRSFLTYQKAEKILMDNGHEESAHLVAGYKFGLIAVCLYFLIKSGLDHKYFLMIIALPDIALSYAYSKTTPTDTSSEVGG